MQIWLNGEALETAKTTLEALVESQGFDVSLVATALNGEFVPRNLRSETPIHEGDKVEVLRPMQGG